MDAKKCITCKLIKPYGEFGIDKSIKDGFSRYCKICKRINQNKKYQKNREHYLNKEKQRRKDNPERYSFLCKQYRRNHLPKKLLKETRYRAKKKGLEFNLILEDIIVPKQCPILGIELKIGDNQATHNSPTVDRIDNSKGYIKENIRVISWRANKLKSDASFEEIETLCKNWNNK